MAYRSEEFLDSCDYYGIDPYSPTAEADLDEAFDSDDKI